MDLQKLSANEALRFWAGCLAILAVMAATMVWAAAGESAVYDEPIHMAAGLESISTGRNELNIEHPPLVKMMAGAGLRLAGAELPRRKYNDNPHLFNFDFIGSNRIPKEQVRMAGRLAVMVLPLMLVLILGLFVRERAGVGAALVSMAMLSLDPNLLAHGRLVTTDAGAALAMFAVCSAWWRDLERPTWPRLAVAALALGFALSVKFSCVVALALLPALALARRGGWGWVWRYGVVAAGAAAFVLVPYLPSGWHEIGPSHPWWRGLLVVVEHNRTGHDAYLLGGISKVGGWLYFPTAFAVKSTLGLLLSLGVVFWTLRRGAAAWVWLPPLALMALAMASNLNIGIRHILPVYAFLYAAVGLAWKEGSRRVRLALAALLLIHAGESLAVAPNHLGFFNAASGGMERGDRLLLDSNIDWGQDLAKLPGWIKRNGVEGKVWIRYFGMENPDFYHNWWERLPESEETKLKEEVDGFAFISVNLVHDLYLKPGAYRWLREQHRPVDRLGASILVYDLREQAPR